MIDLKLVGYSISSVSVALLGAVAWPSPGEPAWKSWALAAGMLTSVAGMFSRYLSHLKDKRNIRRAAHGAEPKQ